MPDFLGTTDKLWSQPCLALHLSGSVNFHLSVILRLVSNGLREGGGAK